MLKNKVALEPSEHPGEHPRSSRARWALGPWLGRRLPPPPGGPAAGPTVLGLGIRMAFDFFLSNFSVFNCFCFPQREAVYLGQQENL